MKHNKDTFMHKLIEKYAHFIAIYPLIIIIICCFLFGGNLKMFVYLYQETNQLTI